MSSDTTPRLNLPLLQGGQAQKHLTLNDGLMRLESLVQAQVLSRTVTAEPASPADGDSYILPASATGAVWAGLAAGAFVRAESGTWESVIFPDGAIVHIADENRFVILIAGEWTAFEDAIKSLDNLLSLGIGTAAGSTNVLALKGAAALLSAQYAGTGGSGDFSLALNKETGAGTTQILWQTNYSTRAIWGLLGDDDLTLKVSADGTSFVTALSIDRASGLARFAAQASDPSSPPDGAWWYNSTDARLRARQDGRTFELLTQGAPGMVPASGRYVLNAATGAAPSSSLTGMADRMAIAPWVPAFDCVCDQLGVNVTTGVATAQIRIVVYASDADGRPAELVVETADIDCSAAGPAAVAAALTFRRGRQYWLGVRHASTAALSALAVEAVPALDAGAVISTTINTVLRRSLAYATSAPSTWGYVVAEAQSDTPAAIFMRLA